MVATGTDIRRGWARQRLSSMPQSLLMKYFELPFNVAILLVVHGYDHPKKVAAATDAELLAIPRLGYKTVQRLREWQEVEAVIRSGGEELTRI